MQIFLQNFDLDRIKFLFSCVCHFFFVILQRKIVGVMKKTLSVLLTLMLLAMCSSAVLLADEARYVGGDISLLPRYEQHNSPYRDAYGKNIDNLLTWFMSECGWNTFRVRLFVNPGTSDPSVCQDLSYVTSLGQRIKAAGAYFMLDFHYSDTWVDASHIQAPAAWKGKSDAEMAKALGDYTRDVLMALKSANATPDLVQVGNEIMYGLCDIKVHPYDYSGDNWTGYLGLLQAGCAAVRATCPQAKIIIHTDRPNEVENTKYYYNKLINAGVDFDILGLSYYPFWHGYLNTTGTNLVGSLQAYAKAFPDKRIHIVETAYNFQYWPNEGIKYDTRSLWGNTKPGQYQFVKDLVDALKPLKSVTGLCYWFPEEAGNGDDTDWNSSKGTVITTWLNRGFWKEEQSSTGHDINRAGQLSNDAQPYTVCAPYYMAAFVKELPAGIERLQNTDYSVQKVLCEGRMKIIRGEKEYSVLGF